MNKKAIALRWYKKGILEDNCMDKFISLWISFNALYSSGIRGEPNQIEAYVNKMYCTKLDTLLTTDAYDFFRDTVIKNCDIRSQQNKPDTRDKMVTLGNSQAPNKEKLVALMKCIYQARCNLFHGDKNPGVDRDNIISQHASDVLAQLLNIIFS